MLKIIDDKGVILCEFSDSGIFGMIDNAFLLDVASGKYDKNEIRAIFYLMHICNWSNKVDKEASRVSKVIGISQKAYYDLFERLVEKGVILYNEENYYINPVLFRRRRIKEKKKFVWNNRKLNEDTSKYSFDDEPAESEEDSQ
jgi:hypothetical protein